MATHSSVLAWRILWTEGAWWAAIYGVAQSRTRLRRLSSSSSQSCLPLCYSSNTWKPHLEIWALCSFWLESLLHDIPLAYPFPPLSSLLQSQLPSENFSLFSMPHLLPTLPTATFYLFFSCPVCLGWVFVAVCRIFSSYGQQGLPQVRAQASPYGGFSRCGAPALGHLGFSSPKSWLKATAVQAQERWHMAYLPRSTWDLPRPGTKPISPALQSAPSTGLPGKPSGFIFIGTCLHLIRDAAAAAEWLQSCLTLWDPMGCSLPGSFAHGILQTRMGYHFLLQGG